MDRAETGGSDEAGGETRKTVSFRIDVSIPARVARVAAARKWTVEETYRRLLLTALALQNVE